MGTTRVTLRLTDEAYQIIMMLPPKVRTKTISEVITRANARGWINEIKSRETKAILQSVGLSIEDVLALRDGKTGAALGTDPFDANASMVEDVDEPILAPSIQERLNKLVDF